MKLKIICLHLKVMNKYRDRIINCEICKFIRNYNDDGFYCTQRGKYYPNNIKQKGTCDDFIRCPRKRLI